MGFTSHETLHFGNIYYNIRQKKSDQVSTADLLNSTKMLTINQLNAQIKLVEIWKASYINNYHIKLNRKEVVLDRTNTRSCTQGKLIIPFVKPIMQKTCITDATRIWISCPLSIINASWLAMAKTEIQKFVKTLPIWNLLVNINSKDTSFEHR